MVVVVGVVPSVVLGVRSDVLGMMVIVVCAVVML